MTLVGTSAIVIREGKILLGKRKSERGLGQFGAPGGRVELGEDPRDACIRELKEETGLEVNHIGFLDYASWINDLKEHWICLFFQCYCHDGQKPKNREPKKSEVWKWYPIDSLPEPLFWDYNKVINLTGRITPYGNVIPSIED